MYSIEQIQTVWRNTDNPLILRQFVGNPNVGWKVAWSDRMISLYGGIWLFGLLWSLIAKRDKKVSVWVFIFLALPMALDGTTHLVSDLNGLFQGFRYTNDWLVALTHNAFPSSFYIGDGLGSFNSWMRWVTGLLFSFGLVWWAFPYVEEQFASKVSAR